jgi:hypothetical protein
MTMVNRVIAAPVDLVWRVFVDGWHGAGAATAGLSMTILEPGRRCRVSLAEAGTAPARIYAFAPVEVGAHHGETVVTVVDVRSSTLAERLFDLVAGGFVARTVEGAVRKELDALAAACTTRVNTLTAA